MDCVRRSLGEAKPLKSIDLCLFACLLEVRVGSILQMQHKQTKHQTKRYRQNKQTNKQIEACKQTKRHINSYVTNVRTVFVDPLD